MSHTRKFANRRDNASENADYFAIELLMPKELFLKAVNDDGIRNIKDLSDLFLVPEFCVIERANQLKQMGLIEKK